MALPWRDKGSGASRGGRWTAPPGRRRIFAARRRSHPCQRQAPGLIYQGLRGPLAWRVTSGEGRPVSSSYPAAGEPPTFSLISRSFAFRSGATFTGLIGPDFFQGLADEHQVRFGSGKGDTYGAP